MDEGCWWMVCELYVCVVWDLVCFKVEERDVEEFLYKCVFLYMVDIYDYFFLENVNVFFIILGDLFVLL